MEKVFIFIKTEEQLPVVQQWVKHLIYYYLSRMV